MGHRVRVLTLSEGGLLSEFKLTWDGTSDAGEPLASGTYFIVVTTPTGRHTVSVVLVR